MGIAWSKKVNQTKTHVQLTDEMENKAYVTFWKSYKEREWERERETSFEEGVLIKQTLAIKVWMC